jgi:hypothetical protein
VDSANWNRLISFGQDGDPIGQVHNIAIDSQNNVYVIGAKNYNEVSNIADGFIVKYASDGTEITTGWDKTISQISSDLDNPYGDIDSADNLYIIGTQDQQWVIKKYSSNGTEITTGWNKKFGHPSYDNKGSGQNIRVNRLNDCVFAVGFAGFGSEIAWVRGFNPDGTDIAAWDKVNTAAVYGSGGRGIAFDGTSYVYIGGFINNASYDRYASLLKYDSDGTLLWSKHCFNGWEWPGSIRYMDVGMDQYVYLMGRKKIATDGTEITSGWPKTSLLGAQAVDTQNHVYGCDEIHGAVYKDWKLTQYLANGTLAWAITIPAGELPKETECNVAIAVFR